MVSRRVVPGGRVILAVAVAGALWWTVGRNGPADLAARGGDHAPYPTLVWAVGTQDCLGCSQLAPVLRRLKRAGIDSVDLTVVHVGDAQAERLVDRFLRTQRVGARVSTMSPIAFKLTHDVTLPVMVALLDGEVRWSAEGINRVDEDELLDALMTAFADPGGRDPITSEKE